MEYLEIINSAVLVILGVLFYVQSRVVSSIKTFMEIFDTKKVKEFADMREETAIGKAMNLIRDDEKVKQLATDVVKDNFDHMAQYYADIMGKRYVELLTATTYLLQNCLANKEDEQRRFIDEFLPNNKEKILPFIFPEDSESDNS